MSKAPKAIALIDCNCIGHICRHGMKGLTANEMQTGVIYGFMLYILRLAKATETSNLVFAWDSRKHKRTEVYPEYKKARIDKRKALSDEEAEQLQVDFNQFRIIRTQILPELGFVNNFVQTGYEADDIIAKIARSRNGSCHDTIVVSADQDLYQLLLPTCWIYNPLTKKHFGYIEFKATYGIEPYCWARVKAIGGCSSDGIPGVKGVGEDSAIRFMKDDLTGQRYDAIRCNAALIDKYLKLTSLPFPGMSEIVLKPNAFSYSGFRRVCDQYNLRTIYQKAKDWTDMFEKGA